MTDQINKVLCRAVACFSLLMFCQEVFAQVPSINATINRSNILIGEPIQYKVQVSLPADALRLKWMNIPDSIEHFEVIERSKIDSTEANGSVNISQIITLTSFDSGRNMIPVFEVEVEPGGDDSTVHLFTDSIPINVSYSPLDSTKTFHDIKSIIEVSDKWPWWMWAALALSIILAIGLIVYLVRQYNKKKQQQALIGTKLSPYDEAIEALNELQKQPLLMNGEVNRFHTRLSGIFRRYVSRKHERNMLTLTSAEMLVALSSVLTSDYTSALASSLRMGDAVKFAKYVPPVLESEEALSQVRRVIEKLNQSDNSKNHTT